MNKFYSKKVSHFGRCLLLATAATLAAPALEKAVNAAGFNVDLGAKAFAQDTKKKRALPGISEAFFKKLGKVADLASPPERKDGTQPPGDFNAALKELKDVEKDCSKCNAYELAQIYNYYGWIYYSLEDFKNSIKYYRKVIEQSPNIPWGLELQVTYTLVQLMFAQEDYADALKMLNTWMGISDTIGDDAYYLKSQICYQMDDKACALENINIAVKMAEKDGNVAKEPWLSLQKALYLEKEDYKSSLPIIEKMVRHYPKKSYWQQLAGVYGMLEREKDQYYTLDAAYTMGALEKEQQLLNLAYLSMANEYPYKAAKIVEKGMKDKIIAENAKNLETLAIAWRQAKDTDKAIPAMQRAAEKSDNGDLYGQLLGLYLYIDDNKKAVEAGKKALAKGDLKRAGEINLNLGIAHLELAQYESAIKAFKKAKEDKRVKRTADNWLQHAQREKFRAEQLAAAAG
ncbi:putative PAS/PAC sensor protein [Teredinibacter turnerae T7901]|uniref:PAS/PAC sensor protein n=1 Tax=Teredinibacter turnerae (strain ATCC 39867 / T7901) TaxID=377629 RepID=C5BMB0_TERTT|nr:tetratricopeptide repeat protein [Teredinibacter turnerae]ACR13460.1 putative PAS/PAC sensor protein [Teredinibacter turnerae T7901]